MNIEIASITIPPRLRQDYTADGKLASLKDSLTEYGQIQSIVLTDKYELIAGGRRLAAVTDLGWTHIRADFLSDLSESRRFELELEENMQREDMTWQEKALAIHKIHEYKQRETPGVPWGLRQTGALCKVDFTYVGKLVAVAERLLNNDDEVAKAPNLMEAYTVLLRRREDALTLRLAEMEKAQRAQTAASLDTTVPHVADLNAIDDTTDTTDYLTVDLSSNYHQGDCIEHMRNLIGLSFDHVVTDIPYGIDMANVQIKDIDIVADQHDVVQNMSLFEPFLQESYRLIRPGGYCIFWYDLVHHELLRNLAKMAGFKVQEWPLVWCKTHACKNDAANVNFTKATEVAMVCRKGNATLVETQAVNYILGSSAEDRKRYDNPFAKPQAVWSFLYKAVAHPGQRVLDPFAGESSSALAAIPLGLHPYNIELIPRHHERALAHIAQYYRTLHAGKVRFV